jgi:hypothetical protein
MSKKLGEIRFNDEYNKDTKYLWLDLWNSKRDNKTYITLYFTNLLDPRHTNNWIIDLANKLPYPCNTIKKGTYKHGFYWRINITLQETHIYECVNILKNWSYNNVSIKINKDVDDLIASELAKAL